MIQFVKTRDVKSPNRGTAESAGLDFYVPNDRDKIILRPGEDACIPSGIYLKIPTGKALIFSNKSGIALKKKLLVGACVVDSDYQGEVHLHLFNVGKEEVIIAPGDKIIQGVVYDVDLDQPEEVESLEKLYNEVSERGSGGFGSTNLK